MNDLNAAYNDENDFKSDSLFWVQNYKKNAIFSWKYAAAGIL